MKPFFAILYGIIGAALIYYGVYPLRRGITMGLILAALGLMFLASIPASYYVKARWPQLYRTLRAALSCVLALGAVLLAVASLQILSRYNREEAPENSVVVVLGAGLSRIDHTTPSLTLAQRLDTAAAYLAEHPNALCVVTGGRGASELVTEAQAMKTYLTQEMLVDASRIIMEEKARDTQQNLAFTADILRDTGLMEACGGNVALVTSGFHEFRSCHFAKDAGLTPFSLPAPILIGLNPMYWMREALGVVLEVWLGRN